MQQQADMRDFVQTNQREILNEERDDQYSQFLAAISFILLRALPALNHSICPSFMVWFR